LNDDQKKPIKTKEPKFKERSKNHSNSEIIKMMLDDKKPKVIDSETMIMETQKRVWGALKQGFEYEESFDESDKFLREHISERLHMIVLYVDLSGSTSMTLELPAKKIATIFGTFLAEMAYVIQQHNGFVLKFVGDAVIGYFIAENNALLAADAAVNCAKSMISIVEKGINPILNQYDYPDLQCKIGMDYGDNIVVRYGTVSKELHVDLLGPGMSIAAKIQNLAKPNQILIGKDVYTKLHPSITKSFEEVQWEKHEWVYHDRETGKLYPIFAHIN